MIVFFGSGEDSCMRMAVDFASEFGIEHRFIDQCALDCDDLWLKVGPMAVTCSARVSGEMFALDDVIGVYARPLGIASTTQSRAFTTAFTEWLDQVDTLVVNRPISMRSNSSKPYQSQLIGQAGFSVPETLVTNDPEAVRAFHRQHGRVIFKSTSGIRSIVRELDDDYLANVGRVRSLPTQFQAFVEGVDVRVHVVGEQVFATEVISTAIDYRYAERDGDEVTHRAVGLDAEMTARCRTLASTLQLPLCGIDLRRTPGGTYVCFEVNPMPAFSYYVSRTGQPIVQALVELLAGEA